MSLTSPPKDAKSVLSTLPRRKIGVGGLTNNFNNLPSPAPDVKTFRKNRASAFHFGALTSARTNNDRAKKEPAQGSHSQKVRDENRGPTCKSRPKNNRGNGGSRAYIPWCDKKT